MSEFRDYYDVSNFSEQHIAMLEKINELGPGFAERAVNTDLNAEFPTENLRIFPWGIRHDWRGDWQVLWRVGADVQYAYLVNDVVAFYV